MYLNYIKRLILCLCNATKKKALEKKALTTLNKLFTLVLYYRGTYLVIDKII